MANCEEPVKVKGLPIVRSIGCPKEIDMMIICNKEKEKEEEEKEAQWWCPDFLFYSILYPIDRDYPD